MSSWAYNIIVAQKRNRPIIELKRMTRSSPYDNRINQNETSKQLTFCISDIIL